MRALLLIGLLGCTENDRPGGSASNGGNPNLEPAIATAANNADVKRPVVPLQPGIRLSSDIQLLEHGVFSNAFNFQHLGVLWVRVTLPGMGRNTIVALKLISPTGDALWS